MSSTNAPFGMRPSFHPSGLDRAVALTDGIVSGYSSAILKGQPVKLATTGVIQAAAAGDSFLGAFAGVQWTDTTGRVRISNYWPASTAYVTGSCIAYFYNDPAIVYDIQADGSLPQTTLGAQSDFSNVTDGSTTTGLSQCTISTTVVAAGSSAQMKIVGLYPGVDNAWGDAYTVVQVQVNESQFNASVVAV
jgi:hypothetical protein